MECDTISIEGECVFIWVSQESGDLVGRVNIWRNARDRVFGTHSVWPQ